MKLSNKYSGYILASLVVLSFALAIGFLPFLPDQIATHWGVNGEANGYSSKIFGSFLLPIIILVMVLLFLFIPRIDPMKENIWKIKHYYDGLILAIAFFLFLIQLQTTLWNLGVQINPVSFMPVLVGLIIGYAGYVCMKADRNWTIGIRTPWTLSDEDVWKKTNVLCGKFMIGYGILACLGVLLKPFWAFMAIIVPVIFGTAFAYVYSYVLYRRKHK